MWSLFRLNNKFVLISASVKQVDGVWAACHGRQSRLAPSPTSLERAYPMRQRLPDYYVRYPARSNHPRTYQSPKRPTGAPCAPGLPAADTGTGTAAGTTAAGAAASGTTAPCARKPHARQQDESPGSQAWALVIVELGGFEPPTSSMPWKRATNCAIAPRWETAEN